MSLTDSRTCGDSRRQEAAGGYYFVQANVTDDGSWTLRKNGILHRHDNHCEEAGKPSPNVMVTAIAEKKGS